jgi:hypothetical protein
MQVKSKLKNTVSPVFFPVSLIVLILEAYFFDNYFWYMGPTVIVLYFMFSQNPRTEIRRIFYSLRRTFLNSHSVDTYHVRNIQELDSLKDVAWWTESPKANIDGWDEFDKVKGE